VSFVIAVIHLVTARLREAVGLMPNQQALASVGWATLLVGMFGIVWFLFFTSQTGGSLPGGFKICLLAGFLLAVLFSAPDRNPLKRVGIGFAASLLPALSTFGDTMSYIRLMAVSIAGVYIAQVFNMMSAQLASAATWFAGAPVAIFGHALNIGLCLIAILAHGVRLNMLEFSSNAGVQWGGYPFEPFAKSSGKES
jgi:V/A-type H+-transporting ATPase subunit I